MKSKLMIGYENTPQPPLRRYLEFLKWLKEYSYFIGDGVELVYSTFYSFFKKIAPLVIAEIISFIGCFFKFIGDILEFCLCHLYEFLTRDLPTFLYVVSKLICFVFYIFTETIKCIAVILTQYEDKHRQDYYSLIKKRDR